MKFIKTGFPMLVVLIAAALAGCNNSNSAPSGIDAQRKAVIGGTPPPEAQRQFEAARAEQARKQAEGQAKDQAAKSGK